MPHISLLILSIYLKEPIRPPSHRLKEKRLSGCTSMVFLVILIHPQVPITLQMTVVLTRVTLPGLSAAFHSELEFPE